MTTEETIQINVDLDDQLLEDVLVTAFEGGSNYWIKDVIGYNPINVRRQDDTPYSIWLSEAINNGGHIKIYPDDEDKSYVLSKEKFVFGLKLWIVTHPDSYTLVTENGKHTIDAGDIDADDADAILQYALFGKVVYG
jgi:hypothetical protein